MADPGWLRGTDGTLLPARATQTRVVVADADVVVTYWGRRGSRELHRDRPSRRTPPRIGRDADASSEVLGVVVRWSEGEADRVSAVFRDEVRAERRLRVKHAADAVLAAALAGGTESIIAAAARYRLLVDDAADDGGIDIDALLRLQGIQGIKPNRRMA